MMSSRFVRRAAAALPIAGVLFGAQPVLAQGTGASVGTVRRDSAVVRLVIPSSTVRDSVLVLVRALNDVDPASPEFATLKVRIDSLMRSMAVRQTVIARGFGEMSGGMGGRAVMVPRGWIGLNLQGLKSEFLNQGHDLVEYLDYPSVVSVDPSSPAARAGIVPGDVVVAYDGFDLRTHRLDLAQILRPERTVAVTVRRDGETREVPIVVSHVPTDIMRKRDQEVITVAKHMAETSDGTTLRAGGFGSTNFLFMSNGWFGVTLTNVNADLSRALKLDRGVLVTDAPEGSPGYRSGLRAGDVIVELEGDSTPSIAQLRRVFAAHGGDHAIEVRIVRDKKARKLTLAW
jgi:S1-C subfamily serine protease